VNAGFEKRLLVVWLALCAVTVGSFVVGSSDGSAASGPRLVITACAITIAIVKVRVIFREFMEVRHAPVLLRRLTDLWVIVTAVSLFGVYWVGSDFSTG